MLSKITLEDVNTECNEILANASECSEEFFLGEKLELAENIIATIASGDGDPWPLCQIYMSKLYPGESARIFLPSYIDKEYHSS